MRGLIERLVTRTGSLRRDERGAVAVAVALLMVPMLVISALVVDLGDLYASRQRLQTGADGSVTILMRHESPGPDATANWLPAPVGKFRPVLLGDLVHHPVEREATNREEEQDEDAPRYEQRGGKKARHVEH